MSKRLFLLFFWPQVFASILSAQKPDCPRLFAAMPARMNVLYIGVDNPVLISVAGVPEDSLEVIISQGTITHTGKGLYTARVVSPGAITITISSKNKKATANLKFRAKRIPDPVPALGAKFSHSDTIGLGEFKAQQGIAMILENFDFDAKCNTVEFNVTQIGWSAIDGKRFVKTVKNSGARFNTEVLELINDAWPGDIFIFGDITARCTGDEKDRKLNSLVFFMDDRE